MSLQHGRCAGTPNKKVTLRHQSLRIWDVPGETKAAPGHSSKAGTLVKHPAPLFPSQGWVIAIPCKGCQQVAFPGRGVRALFHLCAFVFVIGIRTTQLLRNP